jgi:RNA polymerase sigma-70 factor (ECF subfamily)
MTGSLRSELGDFVRTEYTRVIAAVGRATGESQGAADAVHDVLVRLLSDPPEPAPRNIAAWVTVAASNRARDVRRSRLAEARARHRLADLTPPDDDPSDLGRLDVIAAVERLPDRQREVCVLHYLADETVESVARRMGVSEGTVKTNLFRARRSLAALQ